MTTTADEHKALGNKAFAAGHFDEAVKHFTSAIQLDPSNHVLFSNRSAAHASLKQFDLARKDAEQTVQLNPAWPKGYSRLGAAHHGAGNLEAAREAYKKGLELEPGSALMKKGLEDVERELAAAEQDPFRGILNEGIWTKIAGNPKLSPYLADQDYVAKVKMAIANPSLAMNAMNDQRIMMTLLTLMGITVTDNPTEAEEAVNAAKPRSRSPSPARQPQPRSTSPKRAASPARPAAATSAAEAAPAADEPMEVDTEDRERAERRAQMLAEKEAGNAAYKRRSFDEALQHYEKAWELSDESEIPILTNMAAVHFEAGRYEACVTECERAVERGRELRADFKVIAKALARAGNALVKMDKLEEAVKYYQRSLTEHRTSDTLNRLRETEKALEQAKKAAYHDPALSDAARDRGNALFKEQKFAEAVKEYTEAIARNEADPRAYSNRATCYHKLGAIPEALKDCDAAITRDPSFVKAYLRKAAIQHMTREYTKALETCEQAAGADTDGKHAAEIQAQMQRTTAAMYGMGGDDSATGADGKPMTREERAKQALKDPEIQAILADPIMNQILSQMQQDPGAVREHMKNPTVAGKIRKLIAAGILGTA